MRQTIAPTLLFCQMVTAAVGLLGLSGCQVMSHGQNAEGVRMYEHAYYEGALQQFQKAIDFGSR